MELLKVLITVKTYPMPPPKYDELVCTAGVTEDGSFIRLYPINYRDLPSIQRYEKYQWIEVMAEKHTGRDPRKESYRPNPDTLKMLGESISTGRHRDWAERAKYVLAQRARSMEDLWERQKRDKTSLGIFKPRIVHDLKIVSDKPVWKAAVLADQRQQRLFDTRKASKKPPRKVPFKFSYVFECDDERCNQHKMMIEDWEVEALYWRMVDKGLDAKAAAEAVREKFFDEICASDKDTHFFVGTVLAHGTWVIVGVFYPKIQQAKKDDEAQGLLFG